jgi:glycosyltransferase involved in cell wall biosynthesis
VTGRPLRICFVAWRDLAHPQAGGSEVLVDRLLVGLQARGHEVALVCGGPAGRRSYPVTVAGGTFTQYLLAPLAVLRRHRRADLVVDVSNGIPFFAPLWRRGAVVLIVHHVHGRQWRERFTRPVAALGWFLERAVVPRLYRRALTVAVSASTAAALEGIGVAPDRLRTVTQGIEVGAHGRVTMTTGEPTFVALGRLVPHKGVDRVLRAWDKVHAEVGGRLVIIGDGPERAALAEQAGPGVEIVGHVDEARKWELLDDAWCLVHGAHNEGWGIAVMEAAAAARPTLAFDVPGVRDSVVDGHTGVLVADEEALVDAWVALARDPERCARLGAAALERAFTLGWDATLDRFLAVVDEVVT